MTPVLLILVWEEMNSSLDVYRITKGVPIEICKKNWVNFSSAWYMIHCKKSKLKHYYILLKLGNSFMDTRFIIF